MTRFPCQAGGPSESSPRGHLLTPAAPLFRALFALAASASLLLSQDEPPSVDADHEELSRLLVHGYAQIAFVLNTDRPRDGLNFGRLFDDRANRPRLQSLSATLEVPFRSSAEDFDVALKAQLAVGSDMRYTHGLGLLDEVSNGSVHPDVVEAWIATRTRLGPETTFELKAGTFPSLCGLESIDPTGNWLFSRSYIFNFGVPFRHAGLLATLAPTAQFRLHAGIVTGVNTVLSDNNDALSFHGGASLDLLGGDLALGFGILHGPENDDVFGTVAGVDPDDDARTILDVTLRFRASDSLTVALDANLGWDRAPLGLDRETPEWYGLAVYAVLDLTEEFSVAVRGELFRDDDGFVVTAFGENDDAIDLLRGSLNGLDPRTAGGGATTYFAMTVGATYRPTSSVRLLAEVRFDTASDSRPFDDGRDDSQTTLSLSALVTF